MRNSETYSKKIIESYNYKSNLKLKTAEDYLKNGYSLIRRNPQTKKVEITHSYNYEAINKELESKKYKRGIETMIHNWNSYRDEINNILGDTSPYCNYKETIQKMIDEDNYYSELYRISSNNIHNDNDSDYNSENEDVKYLLS
jgi:hypothetical protein